MEIVGGGEKGIDSDAKRYAQENNVPMKEFLPGYKRFGRAVPLKHNLEIIAYADVVIAFWDGQSQGTKFVINNCKKQGGRLWL